ASPATFLITLVHVLPPSRVTCTLPSSVPTQITLGSTIDGAIVRIVQWNSAAVLSVTIGSPDDFCLLLSLVVRSGLMISHDCPWLVDLNTPPPPKYTVVPSAPIAIGEFQLKRCLWFSIASPTEPTRLGYGVMLRSVPLRVSVTLSTAPRRSLSTRHGSFRSGTAKKPSPPPTVNQSLLRMPSASSEWLARAHAHVLLRPPHNPE